ncbi:MAG: MarR family transcriptional regulator [Xanthomonadales bacterium]|jgi:DNA-binding MarR family transcriptional regulator|nr:MarR family transcriptional regulator [Xanthomonadales bacterium]
MQTSLPDSGADETFELERFLPYRLSLLTNTISQGIAASYRQEHDISVTEWRILAVLGRFPGLTASEVTERTAMDKVTIHRAVKTLVQKGLLERQTDSGDRRRRRLFITAKRGREVLKNVIPRAREYEKKLLAVLDTEEAGLFMAMIEKLHQQAVNTHNP